MDMKDIITCYTKSDLSRVTRWLTAHPLVRYAVRAGEGGTMIFTITARA